MKERQRDNTRTNGKRPDEIQNIVPIQPRRVQEPQKRTGAVMAGVGLGTVICIIGYFLMQLLARARVTGDLSSPDDDLVSYESKESHFYLCSCLDDSGHVDPEWHSKQCAYRQWHTHKNRELHRNKIQKDKE